MGEFCRWADGHPGDEGCTHDWDWDGGSVGAKTYCTGPPQQHRTCRLCGRRECVWLSDDGTRLRTPEDDAEPREIIWGSNVMIPNPRSGFKLKGTPGDVDPAS